MSDLVVLSSDASAPGVATLTLNRPEQRNAMSIELLEAAHARVDDVAAACAEGGEREAGGPIVLLVTGAGRSFCAGMDLKQVLDGPGEGGAPEKLLGSLAELTVKLRALPCVTLAVVNGAAIGGGCGLATVCDLAITHADAKLGFPEVDLGLCPAVVAPWVVRKIGAGKARAVLLRGGTMSGREAGALGLVDEVVEERAGLDAAARAIAERLAGGGPVAIRATKELLNELDGSLGRDVVRRGAGISAAVLSEPAARDALRARFAG